MTDREKLVELLKQASIKCQREANVSWEEFADHLLANGVIVLPCKVGDAVWIIDDEIDGYDEPYPLDVTICAIGRDRGGVWVKMDLPLGFKRSPYIGAFELGKTVFLTREEAEAALREGQG